MCKISFDFRNKGVYNKPLKKIIRPSYKDLPNYFLLALNEEEILAEKRNIYDEEMKRLTFIYDDFDTCKEKIIAEMEKTIKKVQEK